MPRYFFDLADGGREIDDVGTELSNLNEARTAAIVFAGRIISDHPEMLANGFICVIVSDESGDESFRVIVTVVSTPQRIYP
jgi:hypothetical protein